MFKRNNPEIDTDRLVHYLRERHAAGAERSADAPDARGRGVCRLDEILVDSPQLCVVQAYRALLQRDPTSGELRRAQARIKAGGSRLWLALCLRWSREGRARRVRITGIGRRLATGLDARLRSHPRLARVLDGCRGTARVLRLPADVVALKRDRDALVHECKRLTARIENLEGRLANRAPDTPAPRPTDPLAEVRQGEALYLAFEDRFRGSDEQIRARLLPCLQALTAANAGTPERPILDLGCGRGEWLALLAEHGLTARGIDSSAAMVETARMRGRTATSGDAVAEVASCPPASLGAVTAFHLAEHLPFARLVQLLDRALEALAPGGVLLLETPNPENLLVGSSTFWLDPTHRRPLPPPLLAFLAEQRGYSDVRIETCHPYPDDERPPVETAFERAAEPRLFGPQDYRLWARRSA